MKIIYFHGGDSIKDKLRMECLNDIYKELASLVGIENMEKIYEHYRGQELNFPSKIYSKEYIRIVIKEEYDGTNTKDIARKTGYSERWIKKLTKECEQHRAK
ncbi:MAG: Mor transcription activator family protein [Aminipila sp.]